MEFRKLAQVPVADRAMDPRNEELWAVIQQALAGLPSLPSSVRYYDDFEETFHTLSNFGEAVIFVFTCNGCDKIVDFSGFPSGCIVLLRHIAFDLIQRSSINSAVGCLQTIARMSGKVDDLLLAALTLPITEFRTAWIRTRWFGAIPDEVRSMKQIMFSLCSIGVHPWGPEWKNYVKELSSTRRDKYKVVHSGECFLSANEQALLVDYFDELAALIETSPAQVTTGDLTNACMLLLAFQHGLRLGQIARIKRQGVRLFSTGAVHISIGLTKKLGKSIRYVVRRIKREWCSLFAQLLARDRSTGEARRAMPPDLLFSLRPAAAAARVRRLITGITGTSRTATDLRHTAAQRQVDAGASHAAVSELLGHDSIRTANIYFATSVTQAERVNRAMALSPIYSKLSEVSRTRTIDKEALLALPSDQQIGGVPHGIPIAGIGACTTGQGVCRKNPILSCYTCRKFLPINDIETHQQVVSDLRPVVREFFDAGKGNEESPAYTQLRGTLDAAQRVIADINSNKSGEYE